MQSCSTQLLPCKEREEGERDEEQGVLDCTLASLIDVARLIERDAERRLQERRLGNFTFGPTPRIRAVELQHLPESTDAFRTGFVARWTARPVVCRMRHVGGDSRT